MISTPTPGRLQARKALIPCEALALDRPGLLALITQGCTEGSKGLELRGLGEYSREIELPERTSERVQGPTVEARAFQDIYTA